MLLFTLPLLLTAPALGETPFEVATAMVPPPSVAAAELADVLPADSFLVVRARSLQRLVDDLNLLNGQGPESPERMQIADLFEELEPKLAALAARVALDRPAGLALRLGEGDEPQAWLALPVNDPETFVREAALQAPTLTLIAAQGYVVASSDSQVPAKLGPCAAMARMAPADLSVHVDLERVLGAFKPLVDMGLEQAELQLDGAAPEEALAAEPYFDLARDFLASARTLDLTLDVVEGRIRAGGSFTVGEGTPLTKLFPGPARDLRLGAGLLDPNAALSWLSLYDPAGVQRRQLDATESLAQSAPPKLRKLLELQTESWKRMLPKTTGLTATNLDFSLDGLRASAFVETSEPAALVAELGQTLAAPELTELGLRVEGPSAREVAGTSWTEYRLRVDLETLARFVGEDAAIPAEQRAEAERAMAVFLGPDGLRVGVAPVGGFLVARIGGDDGFARATAARVGGRATGLEAGVLDALARSSRVQAAWLAQTDLGRVLNQFADIAGSLGQEIELPLELVGDSFPMTLHGWVEGPVWSGQLELEAADIARFARAFESGF